MSSGYSRALRTDRCGSFWTVHGQLQVATSSCTKKWRASGQGKHGSDTIAVQWTVSSGIGTSCFHMSDMYEKWSLPQRVFNCCWNSTLLTQLKLQLKTHCGSDYCSKASLQDGTNGGGYVQLFCYKRRCELRTCARGKTIAPCIYVA